MSSIDELFRSLRAEKRKAFMPFITAGDPDLELTEAILRELDKRGSSLCELGIPYSDPLADGPVIQASYTKALDQGVKLAQVFEMLQGLTPELRMPVVTMLSYAIVYRHGLEAYVREASAAGVAGAIIPDLPVEESAALADVCRRADFSLIQLVTPTTPRERAVQIANSSSGFLYYVSVTGITGERTALPEDILENVRWLKSQTPLPICIGFGISRPEHARMLAPAADGVIVGSAMVRRIAAAEQRPRSEVLAELGAFADELVEAAQSHHH